MVGVASDDMGESLSIGKSRPKKNVPGEPSPTREASLLLERQQAHWPRKMAEKTAEMPPLFVLDTQNVSSKLQGHEGKYTARPKGLRNNLSRLSRTY
jgi:hypothetical protein